MWSVIESVLNAFISHYWYPCFWCSQCVINVMLLYPVSFGAKEQLPLKPLSFTLKQSDENPTNVLYMKFMGEYQAPVEMWKEIRRNKSLPNDANVYKSWRKWVRSNESLKINLTMSFTGWISHPLFSGILCTAVKATHYGCVLDIMRAHAYVLSSHSWILTEFWTRACPTN